MFFLRIRRFWVLFEFFCFFNALSVFSLYKTVGFLSASFLRKQSP